MAKTDFKSVDQYIATHPEDVRAILQRVRSTIRKAVPGAEEVISYQIPTYKLHGIAVLYFAGWKQHYSLYPATARLVAAFKDDLAPYEFNNKGTIRFPLSQPVPVKLIERIAGCVTSPGSSPRPLAWRRSGSPRGPSPRANPPGRSRAGPL
jgi:uncharacterized protein YdhG (YjbR/CyaY superfamily)